MTLLPDGAPERQTTHLPNEPSARTYTLASLVALVREGRIRVPHFQRGLRWGTDDAVALIDSVLRGYPIGSLLLWKRSAPAEDFQLGNVTMHAPALEEALYVVDGQQRVTTFLNAFDPKAGSEGSFALVYDLKDRPFRVRAKRPGDAAAAIPLPVLFDLGQLLRWTSQHPQYVDSIDEINEATTRLREFHVPAYEVRSEDDAALRQIYDRMNNAGKRLSRAEAFWGLFAPDEKTAATSISFSTLQDHVDQALHWGRIDDDTILRLFLARRGPDVTRDIHLEFDDERRPAIDFPKEGREEAHQLALEALEKAVRFLRDEAGVPHFTFLAYRYLLAVLVRFFALYPAPEARNLVLLRRWYWRAALAGPGISRGSATGAMRTYSTCILGHGADGDAASKESESIQRLLTTVQKGQNYPPDPTVFRANHSATHVMLCALWDAGPISPDTGKPFTHRDLSVQIESSSSANAACPELFPRAILPDQWKAAVGNRLIMPGIPLEQVRTYLGGGLLQKPDIAVLTSHLFYAEQPITDLAPEDLVRTRTGMFQVYLNEFLARMTGDGFDDSPPLRQLDLDDVHDSPSDDSDW